MVWFFSYLIFKTLIVFKSPFQFCLLSWHNIFLFLALCHWLLIGWLFLALSHVTTSGAVSLAIGSPSSSNTGTVARASSIDLTTSVFCKIHTYTCFSSPKYRSIRVYRIIYFSFNYFQYTYHQHCQIICI